MDSSIRSLVIYSAVVLLISHSVSAFVGDALLCKFVTEDDCGENRAKKQCPNFCLEYNECRASDGFFKVPGSKVCYKSFRDQQRTWAQADRHCKSHGLHLAEDPKDAVRLRKYIVEKNGSGEWHWMGGRGNGGNAIEWQQSGGIVHKYSRLWMPGQPGPMGTNNSHCLLLSTDQDSLSGFTEQPYWSEGCETPDNTLCQVISNAHPFKFQAELAIVLGSLLSLFIHNNSYSLMHNSLAI